MSEITVSTKDQVGDYDAVETAKPGEPIFTLQGGDPIGPATVLFWADEARKLARRSEDEKVADKLLRKAYAAEQVAWAMQDYQRGGSEDEAAPRESISGGAIPEEQRWKAGLTAGCKHLGEAAYHFTEAAAHLPDDQAAALLAAVERIKAISADYVPKRASYGNQPELPIA